MFTETIAGAALCSGPNHVTSMGLIAEGLTCDASREPELLQKYLHEISNLSGNLRGIGLMFFGTVCYSLLHALIRYMSAELHPFELAFFRLESGVVALYHLRSSTQHRFSQQTNLREQQIRVPRR